MPSVAPAKGLVDHCSSTRGSIPPHIQPSSRPRHREHRLQVWQQAKGYETLLVKQFFCQALFQLLSYIFPKQTPFNVETYFSMFFSMGAHAADSCEQVICVFIDFLNIFFGCGNIVSSFEWATPSPHCFRLFTKALPVTFSVGPAIACFWACTVSSDFLILHLICRWLRSNSSHCPRTVCAVCSSLIEHFRKTGLGRNVAKLSVLGDFGLFKVRCRGVAAVFQLDRSQ